MLETISKPNNGLKHRITQDHYGELIIFIVDNDSYSLITKSKKHLETLPLADWHKYLTDLKGKELINEADSVQERIDELCEQYNSTL
jgi:hypothetical protein